ncbi:hypothetical protein [Methanothrix sp.]|uniref:hypothetical protein n=1 Tax=Methanothrix sp. TaxID=90426 RepID=UPI00345EC849
MVAIYSTRAATSCGKEPRVLQIEGQSLGILIGELLLGSGDNETRIGPISLQSFGPKALTL